ncbi:hypothetical protein FKM82_026311 [Ascaphus truei]
MYKHFLSNQDSRRPPQQNTSFERTCSSNPLGKWLIFSLYLIMLPSMGDIERHHIRKWEEDIREQLEPRGWAGIWVNGSKILINTLIIKENSYKLLYR